MQNDNSLRELLQWYVEAGVDETIGNIPSRQQVAVAQNEHKEFTHATLREPAERYEPQENNISTQSISAIVESMRAPAAVKSVQPILPPSKAAAEAKILAEAANTLEELREAVMQFDGCLLKRTAKKTVFSDGNPLANVMLIGEAPGENEDEQGIPFCGKSGQLLDNSLKTIGLERIENLYISNTIFWRPPGNRTPSPEEVAICAPFVKKHIALKNPDLLLLAGGVAGSVLGNTDSVSKMRRKFHSYTNEYLTKEIPAVVIYHPSYLLRQPGQKAAAWQDLLMIQEFLQSL